MANQRLLLLVNPKSGRGRAQRLASHFYSSLSSSPEDRDRTCELRTVFELNQLVLSDYAVVLVFGGDGTVLSVVTQIVNTLAPNLQPALYPVPCGNENLLSKFLALDFSVDTFRQAFDRSSMRSLTVGVASLNLKREYFLSMCSAGFDALVLKNLAQSRTGGVTHASYLIPIIRSFFTKTQFRVTLTVDGEQRLEEAPGLIVFANTTAYARGLCPVPEADELSEELCARFFPIANRLQLLGLLIALLRGGPLSLPDSLFFKGRDFVVSTKLPLQSDGEYLGDTPVTITKLRNQDALRTIRFLSASNNS